MLCDEIVANGAPGSGCDISCLLPTIRMAQKFTLSPEFAAVADALSTDYTGLVRAFPHCRLPFRETWIEVAHSARQTFASAAMQAPRFQVQPKHIGFLLTATRADLSAWKAHLFWSTAMSCGCPAMAMQFDMTTSVGIPLTKYDPTRITSPVLERIDEHPGWVRASDSVKLTMINHVAPIVPDYATPLPIGIPPDKTETFYEILADLSRSDWAGEPAYLMAVIGLINARNAVELQTIDKTEFNRKRAKRGRLPLFSHKVLKIAGRQQRRVGHDPTGDHIRMRQHFCRGHFKTRKTGIFFWHPHLRGDAALGRVHKDYELT